MNIEQIQKSVTERRSVILIGTSILIIVILAIIIWHRPTRSVAAFCSIYKQEDARLAKSYGDTYGVHPFKHTSNNPHDFVTALGKLDAVAPKEIEPDVKTLKLLFEKIDKDPSQALSASLSGMGAESSVSDWTTQHCR